MITNQSHEQDNTLVDQAAASADHVIKSTQRVGALAQRGVDAMRSGSQQLRDKAARASDATVGYVKDEPVKAMLIAAATGAALVVLLGLMARFRQP